MRLYYHPLSTNSRRALMVAHHLGTTIDLVPVDLFKNEQNSPQFLQLNPNHQVPVLDHDGFVLWESYAIMQYLAELTNGQTIYPIDAKGRADVNRWLFWCTQEFMAGVAILNWEHAIKAMIGIGPADPTEVARGRNIVMNGAKILDDHLAHREWICASGLSLADFAISAPLADQERAKLPVTKLANLQRWFRQMQELGAWRSTETSAP